MSKLDELIKEFCPNGVEYKKIGDITNYEQPSKYIVKSTDYNDIFITPVLTAGQTFVLGYTNETTGIFQAEKSNPVIIFDDFTGAFKWVDFPFKVKSSAMKIITAKKDVLIRYLYHLMGFMNYSSNEHKRLWISIYSELAVPIPPPKVQREIVRILDCFMLLTEELTEELIARKKQYEFYRDKLLNLTPKVDVHSIGEVCQLIAGGDVPKDNFNDSKTEHYSIPIISNGIGDKGIYGYTNLAKVTDECVTIAARGAGVGYITYRDYSFYPIIRLVAAIPNEKIKAKYLYYALQKIKFTPTDGGIPQLTIPMISKCKIAVPSVEVQEQIVNILDSFDTIYTNLNSDLPKEIESRQKQYEYYRDKLLTFKELRK